MVTVLRDEQSSVVLSKQTRETLARKMWGHGARGMQGPEMKDHDRHQSDGNLDLSNGFFRSDSLGREYRGARLAGQSSPRARQITSWRPRTPPIEFYAFGVGKGE